MVKSSIALSKFCLFLPYQLKIISPILKSTINNMQKNFTKTASLMQFLDNYLDYHRLPIYV